jgi:nicotinamide-nucleotide amidase
MGERRATRQSRAAPRSVGTPRVNMHLDACGEPHYAALMIADAELLGLSERVGARLRQRQLRIVTAESCSGGWIGKVLTDISGSSTWYLGGVVSYSNALKESLLGVRAATLAAYGAVSEATAREMASGALERLGGDIAVAVTGVAGPDGGTADKPVGTVWFAWAWRAGGKLHTRSARECFPGDREAVRRATVERALAEVAGLEV